MTMKSKSVFGILKTRAEAEQAVDALIKINFSEMDISVLMPNETSTHDFAISKSTKAPEGAAAGAGAGAIIGGALGLLAGFGTLAIPGFGPFLAAGPIMSILAGAGVGGTVGGIGGALIGLGVPEFEAKRYEGYVKDGGILLSVHVRTSEQIERATHCLQSNGAKDIASTGDSKGDWTSYPVSKPGQGENPELTKLY